MQTNVIETDFFKNHHDQMESERRAAFEEFWKYYPLKKGKPKAREMFLRITSPAGMKTRTLDRDSGMYIDLDLKATPPEIVEGAKAFRATLPKKSPESYALDTTYCPHASTWLNQGRWEDQ